MSKYFISAINYAAATKIASERGIKREDFKFVPYGNIGRKESILGFHHVPKDNLIGNFTSDEVFYLTT